MAARHGGNLRKLALRAGRDRDQILDFSASVNPLGPPDGLRAAVARALDRVTEYPDPEAVGLVRALAARHKLTEEQIVVGNGSSEILFAVARACRYRRAVIPVPTYSDYAAAVQAAGRETRFLNLAGCAGTRCDWDLGVGVGGGGCV
jgi:histidinol-phosphate/aromatic aminotransferase/cobyric acid decarboxylase-like protein